MKQDFIFVPRFRRADNKVYFSAGFSTPFMKFHDIPQNQWNYQMYFPNGDTSHDPKDPNLRPTKFESYEYLDLNDIGDCQEDWAPVWAVLGFKDYPNSYRCQSFKFGDITLFCFKERNEVGEYFLKLEGSTTRKAIRLACEALDNLYQWFQDHPSIAEKVAIEWESEIDY